MQLARTQPAACQQQARSVRSRTARLPHHARALRHVCRAAAGGNESPPQTYDGMFGKWRVEPADEFEVWSYRVGLTATVSGFVAAAAICSSSDALQAAAAPALNPLACLLALGLGVSLVQIHIYVDPLKRALQVLWLLGTAGALYLGTQHPEQPLPMFVAQQPWSVWLVGPAAAAVTGVAIKEGLCYGKPEAAGLALLLPLLCLSHLAGDVAGPQVQSLLLAATCATACVFAGRKYSQPVKDDIGDKSVFEFRKLPEAEQARILAKMQQPGAGE